MTSQLRTRPEINGTEWSGTADPAPEGVVLVVDTVDEDVLRHIRRTSTSHPVLVTTDIDEQKLVSGWSAESPGCFGTRRRRRSTWCKYGGDRLSARSRWQQLHDARPR
ncbi:hypothetical protein [Streptomyces hydrogenans]